MQSSSLAILAGYRQHRLAAAGRRAAPLGSRLLLMAAARGPGRPGLRRRHKGGLDCLTGARTRGRGIGEAMASVCYCYQRIIISSNYGPNHKAHKGRTKRFVAVSIFAILESYRTQRRSAQGRAFAPLGSRLLMAVACGPVGLAAIAVMAGWIAWQA